MFAGMLFVYVDVTDGGRPFYVGKGTRARVTERARNAVHTSIAARHGWTRRIIIITSDDRIACQYERQMIGVYKTQVGMAGHWGANLTSGGDGVAGRPQSTEERARRAASIRRHYAEHPEALERLRHRPRPAPTTGPMSESRKDAIRKFWVEHPEALAVQRQAGHANGKLGAGKKKSAAAVAAMRERATGRVQSRTTREKRSAALSAYYADPDVRARHSERSRHGEAAPAAKLTADAVCAIRAQSAAGIGQRKLAAAHGVTRNAIRCVLKRKTWRHVP